jgi:hypothetical protein
MAPPNTDLTNLPPAAIEADATEGLSAMRVCRYVALGVTGLGIVLTILSPGESGPVVGFAGAIAALALYWWKANA